MNVALLMLQMKKFKRILFINPGITPNIINFLLGINICDGIYLGFFTIIRSDARETFVKLN